MPAMQISSQTLPLTFELAHEFASMTKIDNDRELSESRMESHKKKVATGEFYTPRWSKCYCKENGITYRVDGKHSSTLFTQIPIPSGMTVTILEFEAETKIDVAVLYTQFDTPESVKTKSDTLKAITSFNELINSLPVKFKNDISKAFELAINPTKGKCSNNIRERALGMLEPEKLTFIEWLYNNLYIGYSGAKHIWRSPVMAVMYLNYQKDPQDTLEFWGRVRDENGDKPTWVCRQLAKWLTTTSLNNTPDIYREFYVRCMQAWNAHREGNMERDLKYYKNSKLPVIR